MARGGISRDELGELLSAMGIEAEFTPVAPGGTLEAFQVAGEAASLPGCSLMRIQATMKGGERLTGILVVNPIGKPSERPASLSA
jgi:hypothetical protein